MEDWAKDPAAQLQPSDMSPHTGSLFDRLDNTPDVAFIVRHARDNIRTARIDLPRLSVQIIGVIALGAEFFGLGSLGRPRK
jgi:hypothetical protein